MEQICEQKIHMSEICHQFVWVSRAFLFILFVIFEESDTWFSDARTNQTLYSNFSLNTQHRFRFDFFAYWNWMIGMHFIVMSFNKNAIHWSWMHLNMIAKAISSQSHAYRALNEFPSIIGWEIKVQMKGYEITELWKAHIEWWNFQKKQRYRISQHTATESIDQTTIHPSGHTVCVRVEYYNRTRKEISPKAPECRNEEMSGYGRRKTFKINKFPTFFHLYNFKEQFGNINIILQ